MVEDNLPWPSMDWLNEGLEALAQRQPRVEFHATDFYKITLPPVARCARRIHVWPATTSKPEGGNVHGHCWPFRSVIVLGELVEELYSVEIGDDYTHYNFRSSREPLTRVGYANLKLRGRVRHGTGSRYDRPQPDLHRAYPAGPLALSLVTHPLERADSTPVFVPKGAPAERSEESRSLTNAEIIYLRHQLRTAIHANTLETST